MTTAHKINALMGLRATGQAPMAEIAFKKTAALSGRRKPGSPFIGTASSIAAVSAPALPGRVIPVRRPGHPCNRQTAKAIAAVIRPPAMEK